MIVIGADTHKSTHALAAVDAGTGQLLAEREIPAKEQGHLDALRWGRELGEEIVWAIEDCRPSILSTRSSWRGSEWCVSHQS